MSEVNLVENPRRRKSRRHLSALQRSYGFGGGGNPRRRHHRRRRNPALMSLTNPRRRRRSARRFLAIPLRGRRRYANPGLLGGLKSAFEFKPILYSTLGMIGSKSVPMLVKRWWPGMPTTGIGGYAVRIGTTYALSILARKFMKSPEAARAIMAGGVGLILFELFAEQVAPAIGLSGLGNYGYVTNQELSALYGYRETGMVTQPVIMRQPYSGIEM